MLTCRSRKAPTEGRPYKLGSTERFNSHVRKKREQKTSKTKGGLGQNAIIRNCKYSLDGSDSISLMFVSNQFLNSFTKGNERDFYRKRKPKHPRFMEVKCLTFNGERNIVWPLSQKLGC